MTVRSGTGKSHKRYNYYQCTSSLKGGNKACFAAPVNTNNLENLVAQLINNIAHMDEFFEAVLIETSKQKDSSQVVDKKKEILEARIHKAKAVNKRDNLISAIADGSIKKLGPLKAKINDVELEIEGIDNRIYSLESEVTVLQVNPISPSQFKKVYRDFSKLWDELDRPVRRDIVRLLIENINVKILKDSKNGTITIRLFNNPPKDVLTKYRVGSRLCTLLLPLRCQNTNFYFEFDVELIRIPGIGMCLVNKRH